MRALRYPDRSIVIDLSRQSQQAKRAYIRAALPTLGRLSRWQPAGGRLLPATISGPRATRALPHPW